MGRVLCHFFDSIAFQANTVNVTCNCCSLDCMCVRVCIVYYAEIGLFNNFNSLTNMSIVLTLLIVKVDVS